MFIKLVFNALVDNFSSNETVWSGIVQNRKLLHNFGDRKTNNDDVQETCRVTCCNSMESSDQVNLKLKSSGTMLGLDNFLQGKWRGI